MVDFKNELSYAVRRQERFMVMLRFSTTLVEPGKSLAVGLFCFMTLNKGYPPLQAVSFMCRRSQYHGVMVLFKRRRKLRLLLVPYQFHGGISNSFAIHTGFLVDLTVLIAIDCR